MTNPSHRLLSPEELAEYLNVPTSTLRGWRGRGVDPPSIKLGQHVRYRQADVDTWLDEQASRG